MVSKIRWMGAVAAGALAMAGLLVYGAVSAQHHEGSHSHDHAEAAPVTKATAVLQATAGNDVTGTVTFTQVETGVRVQAAVNGLEPNKAHGFHVHEFGDISAPDGTAAGGHFNPEDMDHGGPDAVTRHVGDLGNIKADANGIGIYDRIDTKIALNGPNSILGRGLIVHEGTDDLESQPTGNAGARIAQAVIGVAKAE